MSAYRCAVGFVVSRLLADPAVTAVVGQRVYEGLAPKTGAVYPFITVQAYTDPANTNVFGRRARTRVDLIVRVFDSVPDSEPSSSARIAPVADRIDANLNFAEPHTRPDGVICSSVTYEGAPYNQYEDGRTVRGDGAKVRVVVGPLPG